MCAIIAYDGDDAWHRDSEPCHLVRRSLSCLSVICLPAHNYTDN